MKRLLLNTKVSNIYIISVILITILLLASYFSYAMFTVSKEKNNAISIVTGTLNYDLKVDGVSTDELVVGPNEEKTFTITLSNPNERMARFNFYYVGALPEDVTAGYLVDKDINIPPLAEGLNLEISGSVGASNVYKIRVTNNSNSNVTITLGVEVGLDYNDLSLPSNGHLFDEYKGKLLAELLLADNSNNINTTDKEQTFITGEDPNNYIWYSGKLWRAVSIDPSDNSVKLVTQWNISSISYNESSNTSFVGSNMEAWLNDTSVDGFLNNLRDPEKFIKMDSVWNASETTDPTKLDKTVMVTDPVGLLNIYEYTMSSSGVGVSNGYLNNNTIWWTMTPYTDNNTIYEVFPDGTCNPTYLPGSSFGIRPCINLKSDVGVVEGNGTIDDPYRLYGDNDKDLSGTLLSTRYSGEYIRLGMGENNLYRIVSHENGTGTKITSAEPLKSNGEFITLDYKKDNIFESFSPNSNIGSFLNNTYLNTYIDSTYLNMIEENTNWYLGVVDGNGTSYKLAKYVDVNLSTTVSYTTATIGLLRYGELMAGQFNVISNNIIYGTLTMINNNNEYLRVVSEDSNAYDYYPITYVFGIKPSFNLKSNVIITSGTGTKDNPFEIALD